MTPYQSAPYKKVRAQRRAKAAIAFSALAFAAVGALAWIGLEAVQVPDAEATRLAVQNNENTPVPVKPLDQDVAATQIDRTIAGEAVVDQPSLPPEPQPVIVVAAETIVEAIQTNCVDNLQAFAEAQTIRFEIGSADLESSELPVLHQIGKMAEACADAVIHVAGHSDASGSDIINLALSWQRADNTIATLASLGIDTTRFEPIGYGARAPTSQGDASEDDLDRRVEFQVFEKTGPSQ